MQLEANREHWRRLSSVDSTNEYLLAGDFPGGTVCLAKEQLQGRGRHGRSWLAQAGQALIFSGQLNFNKSELPEGRMQQLPLLSGVALLAAARRALNELTPQTGNRSDSLAIKWPNDLYLTRDEGAAKLAGILVETQAVGEEIKSVIGVGLNWSGVPKENAGFPVPPAALFEDGPNLPPPDFMAVLLVTELNRRLVQLTAPTVPEYIGEANRALYMKGQVVLIEDKKYRLLGVEPDGGLAREELPEGRREVIYDLTAELKVAK